MERFLEGNEGFTPPIEATTFPDHPPELEIVRGRIYDTHGDADGVTPIVASDSRTRGTEETAPEPAVGGGGGDDGRPPEGPRHGSGEYADDGEEPADNVIPLFRHAEHTAADPSPEQDDTAEPLEPTDILDGPGVRVELTPTKKGDMVPSRFTIAVGGIDSMEQGPAHEVVYVKALNLAWLEAVTQTAELAQQPYVDEEALMDATKRGLVYQRAMLEMNFAGESRVTFEGEAAALAYEGVMRGLQLVADFIIGEVTPDSPQELKDERDQFMNDALRRINYRPMRNQE